MLSGAIAATLPRRRCRGKGGLRPRALRRLGLHAYGACSPGRGNSSSFHEESPEYPGCFRLSYEPRGERATRSFITSAISRCWLQALSRYHTTAPPAASPTVAMTAHVAGLSSPNIGSSFPLGEMGDGREGPLRARASSCGGSEPPSVVCDGWDLALLVVARHRPAQLQCEQDREHGHERAREHEARGQLEHGGHHVDHRVHSRLATSVQPACQRIGPRGADLFVSRAPIPAPNPRCPPRPRCSPTETPLQTPVSVDRSGRG